MRFNHFTVRFVIIKEVSDFIIMESLFTIESTVILSYLLQEPLALLFLI